MGAPSTPLPSIPRSSLSLSSGEDGPGPGPDVSHKLSTSTSLPDGLSRHPTSIEALVGQPVELDEDENEGEGVFFYVNRSGFPISDKVYDRMFDFCCKKHPDGKSLAVKCKSEELPEIAIPREPKHTTIRSSVKVKLQAIQTYMESLEYNHTGTQFFDIVKNRPLISLMENARQMISESLPIKCLEAVILGLYLTNGISGLERFTLSFKSMFTNKVCHRHVVLAVYHNGLYGALGMSRRSTLAYKPLHFQNLTDLVEDFQTAYASVGHKLLRVVLGMPVSHDPRSFESIVWRNFLINGFWKRPKQENRVEIERYAKEMRTKMRTSVQTAPKVVTAPSGVSRSSSVSVYNQAASKLTLFSSAMLKKGHLRGLEGPLKKSVSSDDLRSHPGPENDNECNSKTLATVQTIAP